MQCLTILHAILFACARPSSPGMLGSCWDPVYDAWTATVSIRSNKEKILSSCKWRSCQTLMVRRRCWKLIAGGYGRNKIFGAFFWEQKMREAMEAWRWYILNSFSQKQNMRRGMASHRWAIQLIEAKDFVDGMRLKQYFLVLVLSVENFSENHLEI